MADSTIGFNLETAIGACEIPASVEAVVSDDQALVEGLRTGDDSAYEKLITRYQQPIFSLVTRLLNDPGDSLDVTQEVFLKVFRNIGAFRGQSSLKTWIYRIAVNEAHNHRRWFSRHRRQEIGLENDEDNGRSFRDRIPDPSRSPFDVVLNEETHALIEQALQEMNPTFRSAVVLRDVEDLSYEEIAEILQVSLGTVKSRILRGRESLRKALAEKLEHSAASNWAPQTVE